MFLLIFESLYLKMVCRMPLLSGKYLNTVILLFTKKKKKLHLLYKLLFINCKKSYFSCGINTYWWKWKYLLLNFKIWSVVHCKSNQLQKLEYIYSIIGIILLVCLTESFLKQIRENFTFKGLKMITLQNFPLSPIKILFSK